nr:MAG TPA: hypothetical protein [Caudoviricetes sp.]
MSDDKYADDARLIDLSQNIFLKRGSDIIADAIIYHGDCWWKVLGNGVSDGSDFLYAEKAGSLRHDAEEVTIPIDDAKTYLTVMQGAPVQFRDGDLISTEWPDKDLIYVDKALRQAATKRDGASEKDEVHGLFVRRYDSDGDCYYAPAEAEDQGIDSNWFLSEGLDLILEWRPVNIAAVLKEAI